MPRTKPSQTQPFALGTLIAYGAPGLPLALFASALLVFVPHFYAEEMGLGLVATGFVLTLARIWDIAIGPALGVLIDRIDTRFGRRRPWPMLGLAVILVAGWHLFLPRTGVGAGHLLGWSILFYTGLWLVRLPYLAWGAELSPDYAERTRITGWREIFGLLGTVSVASLPILLWQLPERSVAQADAAAMTLLFWLGAGLLPIGLAVLYGAVPERHLVPVRHSGPRRAFKMLARNGAFRWFLGVALAAMLANALQASLFLLFVEHALEIRSLAGPLLVAFFLAAALAIPVWVQASGRFGKHRVWAVAMAASAVATVCVPLLGAGEVWPFLVICLVSGAALGADLALPPAMLADIVDLDTLRSGDHRAGRYFALWAAAGKLAMALALGVAFPALAAFGFSPQTGPTGSLGLLGLAVLFGVAPAMLKLVAAGVIWGFPLTAEAHAAIRRRIEARGQPPRPVARRRRRRKLRVRLRPNPRSA
ncbi:MAG: MFS transporter [Alphaproteobacteria bacterium]|nr:MFS transporter [Alphaproteobacteria bacterium]